MSLYSEMIAEANLQSSILFAYDYTEVDLQTMVMPNLSTGSTTNRDQPVEGAIGELGLTQNGSQTSYTINNVRPCVDTLIWIGRPSDLVASTLWATGYNDRFYFSLTLDLNLVPRGACPYINTYIQGTVPLGKR
jgi:hypothetical protein